MFTQMQPGPAALAAQKTYKVKSEIKPIATTSALIRPENPFSKAKPIAINSLLNSPRNSETVDEPTTEFGPFDTLSETGTPEKPTIFDKLDNKVVKNELALKVEKMEAENVAKLAAATAKADKRLRGKKGGKLVKGIVNSYTATQDDLNVTPEKRDLNESYNTDKSVKREESLSKTASEIIPQLPSLLKP